MTEAKGGARPALNRPATERTVTPATDKKPWRPDPRHVKALDRHIAYAYGPENVRRWAA
ncbi:hypothetical protein [Actinoplanes sp. M2I2]|uniref:hypothetical protein n=1 Tax=Actinoplanes sp. M2I2 TaxID=1734444 RepID=UPI00202043D3|nr:hypothetical protein [Actinoplanes sp. M2I2]